MRFHPARVLPVLLPMLFVCLASPLRAQEQRDFFTLSGGWSWPVAGPVEESYEAGGSLAAAFRTGFTSTAYLGGIEFGYTWNSLDTAGLASANPGSTYSGGDMGLLSITSENDWLFGTPGKTLRPFLSTGIGYYRSFIDDATVTTGSSTESYSTGVYEGSFFGFHAGLGTYIKRDRFGLRLDANYNYLFAGGPNLEAFTARGGLVFYL